MKTKKFNITLLAVTMIITFYTATSYSKIININAIEINAFVPSNVFAKVNDTIQWTRTGGDHTTTCDGSALTSRPPGADPWNAPLDFSNPTFRYIIRVEGIYNYKCIPHFPIMVGVIEAGPSSITQISELARNFELSQNYPNPFNPVTKINFSIPKPSKVSLKIYNNIGREAATLVNERLQIGSYDVNWNAAEFTSGVYYYKIVIDSHGEAGEFIETKKMLLIR